MKEQDYFKILDVEVLASPEELRRFETSVIWQDIVRVLKNEKELCANEFDTVDPEDKLEIVRIQTKRQMLDYLIELPGLLAEQLGAEEEVEYDT